MRLPLVCREGRIPLARSHRVREGSVGEGVSPALDASWTEARADLPVKAESKCCSCCSQAVVAQQLYLRRPHLEIATVARRLPRQRPARADISFGLRGYSIAAGRGRLKM